MPRLHSPLTLLAGLGVAAAAVTRLTRATMVKLDGRGAPEK